MKRIYGNVCTALDLTGKALAYYNMCDPITIVEDADDETGECRYQVLSGREPMHDGWMTADALLRWMEDGYDDATGAQEGGGAQ